MAAIAKPARCSHSTARLLGAGLLVLVVVAAYRTSLDAPFVFDDEHAIENNATIRRLWPPWTALQPPMDGAGVTGRPLVNLSLAVNYALGGLDVRGYHLFNLTLHVLAAFTLWGVLQLTMRLSTVAVRRRKDGDWFAWCLALLWAVHPLLTESVICVVQRNEIMGGLFYLLTLYCFVRSATDPRAARRWQMLTVVACLLGIASKEIVATAPIMVFLFDRTFLAGSFGDAWRQRKGLYVALMATWLPLAWLMFLTRQRAGTVGFDLGVGSWEYLLTQCRALTIYLKLSIWPDPLVLDYGTAVISSLADVWWQGGLIVTLILATLIALWRRPIVGFLGAWFFVILAPSSSVVPLTTQTIAEHRMYLPLIAVLALLVGWGFDRVGRRAAWACVVLVIGSAWMTRLRSDDFRSVVSVWQDTVEKAPENLRAREALGEKLVQAGRSAEAIRLYEETLEMPLEELAANYPAPLHTLASHLHGGLGAALSELGRNDDAVRELVEACRLDARNYEAAFNAATVLTRLGRPAEAIPHFESALKLRPDAIEVRTRFGLALLLCGELARAAEQHREVIRLHPHDVDARNNLGDVFLVQGRYAEAMAEFRTTLLIQAGNAQALQRLAQLAELIASEPPASSAAGSPLR